MRRELSDKESFNVYYERATLVSHPRCVVHIFMDKANHWKITVLEEFLHTITVSSNHCQNYKCFSCNNTQSSLKKNNEMIFYMIGYGAHVIDFILKLFLMTKTALYAQSQEK